MAHQISRGALEAIFFDPERATTQFPVPVLQCLHIKVLGTKDSLGGERYRVVLSDSQNFVQCMLATQANQAVHDGLLKYGSIVRLRSYQAQHHNGKNVMIILDLEVIVPDNPDKIGEPKTLEPRDGGVQNTTIGGAGFYGAKTEPAQESKPQVKKQVSRPPSGSIGGGHGASTIYPIEALSPWVHKWTIKVRVTSKSDIKTWHKNATGEGRLFSVNLLDESSEIRATGFNDAVDQFYDLLQEGQVYYISSPCKVQLAKKQFSNLPCDYEIMFERDTVIEKAEDQSSVPQVRFNFVNIEQLQQVEKDATVDIVGVLKEVGNADQIISKSTQKPYDKRELTLVDDTGYSVRVTVWGKTATEFDASPESIIALKGTRVGDFGGRSLSLLSSGSMAIDPDIPEAHKLKGWYDASGRNASFATHNNLRSLNGASGRKNDFKTIGQVKEENLGMNEEPDYFSIKSTVVSIKQETFCYPACLGDNCNKKVTPSGDMWRCEKCNIVHERPQYRYILNINVSDHTGHLWVSLFDDAARIIMGKSADELMEIREDQGQITAAFEAANCQKLAFRCRAKMEMYNDTPRIRYQALSVAPLDYKSEAHQLADLIKQMQMNV